VTVTAEAASLFDKPVQPVLGGASDWMRGVLGGSVATSLCVIAIAFLGFLLLTGRLRVRRSAEVVLGCFLLLGAGMLAAQLLAIGVASSPAAPAEPLVQHEAKPASAPPPANYDPYAGASLRQIR